MNNSNTLFFAAIYHFRRSQQRRGFSLVEMVVAIGIFSVVVVTAGSAFWYTQDSWRRQRVMFEALEEARWALEFLTNEVRRSANAIVTTDQLEVSNKDGGSGNRAWFWRGNGGNSGDSNALYFSDKNNWSQARTAANRKALCQFVVDNPSGNNLLVENSGLVVVELTVRPNPLAAEGKGNKNITIRTAVRPRN